MAEFYRFRSIDSLLGKHRELEEQMIYFASPEELNDPMEGLRDIVWDGDKIIWTNFFKHYVFCLNRCYFLLNVTQHPRKLETTDIPILERWDEIIIPIEKILFDDIWKRFCDLPYIQEIIEALANTKRKIRYSEIIFYLQNIQDCALFGKILKSYTNHKFIPELKEHEIFRELFEDMDTALEMDPTSAMKNLLRSIKQYEKVEDEHPLDAMFQYYESEADDTRLTTLHKGYYIDPSFSFAIVGGTDDLTGISDFPKLYVEQLDKLLWSKWYTACFTGGYHNSSVWAKYADGHKGACLIFGTVENDQSNNLKLNHRTSNNLTTLPFRKVHYADRPGETDFFRTICRMPTGTLRELWCTAQDGNLSECAAHIESEIDIAAYKELYWNNFFRDVTFKTKDWGYEQEYRLILDDGLGQFNEKDDRALTYNFNSLKGIIFGIKTSTEDKVKIIKIIEKKKKCAGSNQTDFTYFQAYYSDKDGNIRKRKMRLE